MAAEVHPLPQLKLPAGPSTLTPDQKYWAKFSNQLLIPSHRSNPITSIIVPAIRSASSQSLSATAQSDHFAITSGGLLQIYSGRTRKPIKTITRFDAGSNAHSAHIRRDGRVVVAGSDNGTIQVFDTNSRAVLKTWREGKQPVWVTKWRGDGGPLTDLLSCGDDTGVKLWDLTEEKSVRQLWGHQDYVRAGEWMSGPVSGGAGNGASLVVSGSYDQTVRLWDTRVRDSESERGANILTFAMAAPVEAVLPMPAGTTLLASADNAVAVLDLVAARPLTLLRNHQKTVTSLALASHGTRVLTGGLDGHVKVFESKSWNVVAGSKYQSPILSLAVMAEGASQEDKHLLVGMQSGVLSIKTRLSGAQKLQQKEKAREMQALVEGRIEAYDRAKAKKERRSGRGWEKRMRGQNRDFSGEAADIVIDPNASRQKTVKFFPWEKALRRGQYEKALDLALATQSRQQSITLFKQLRYRTALRAALGNRNEITLQPVLKWLTKAVNDPKCVVLVKDVAEEVLELYGENMGQSEVVDRLVRILHQSVRRNVEGAQQARSTLGMIEFLQAGG